MQTIRQLRQCIVITGASQGLGKSMALLLARRGAKLVLADVNKDKLGYRAVMR